MEEQARDEATGQFISSEPTATNYVPYDDGSTAEPDELSVDEAKELIDSWEDPDQHQNIADAPLTLDDLPANVTFTEDQAEKILVDTEAARAADIEQKEADGLRKAIDDLRGEFEQPEDQPAEQKAETEAPKAEEPSNPQAALEQLMSNPQAKEALTKFTSEVAAEVESAKGAYSQGLNVAQEMARASFAENFPEVARLPLDQWQHALTAMAAQEPARFQSAMNILNRANHIRTAQEHEWQQAEGRRQAQMQEYAKAESAKFEASIASVPKAERAEIENAIVGAIGKAGGDVQQFANLMRGSEFASEAVQKMLWDYGRLLVQQDRIANTAKPRPVAPARSVVKPGAPSGKGRSQMGLESLEQRLSASGSEADGWALLSARMNRR
jgi:hypothetical protein